MKLFFKFIGRAFGAFFLHQYLSVKFFLVNLWKAFYHPNRPYVVRTKHPRAYARELHERWAGPRFIGPTGDNAATPTKKKRKHRGGRKHRRKHFNNNKPTK